MENTGLSFLDVSTPDLAAPETSAPVETEQAEFAQEAPTAEPIATPEAKPVEQEPTPDPMDLINKALLSDPEARQAYLRQQMGYQQPPQPQYEQPKLQQPAPMLPPAPPPTPAPLSVETMFPDGFDPYNAEHNLKLQTAAIQEQLNPLLQFVAQQQQEAQAERVRYQEEQQAAQLAKQEDFLEKLASEFLPNYSELRNQETLEAAAVVTAANEAFKKEMINTYLSKVTTQAQATAVMLNPDIQKAIMRKIMPGVKVLADKLQLTTGKKPVLHAESTSTGQGAEMGSTAKAVNKFAKTGNMDDFPAFLLMK